MNLEKYEEKIQNTDKLSESFDKFMENNSKTSRSVQKVSNHRGENTEKFKVAEVIDHINRYRTYEFANVDEF